MKCDICQKENLWLIYIGKDNVCSNCIARNTVFKEVGNSDESRLRKALRSFDINSFEDLRQLKEYQVEQMDTKRFVPSKKNIIKYKKNRQSPIAVNKNQDELDLMSEQDQFW